MNSQNKNTVGGDVLPKPFGGVGALIGTVTRVPANAFTSTININSTNTSIEADFS